MKNSKLTFACVALAVAMVQPVFAQGIPVIDRVSIAETKANFAKEIAEMLKQLEEAKRLYDSVNGVTDMANIVDLLNDPQVRELLGPEAMKTMNSLSGDLNAMGELKGEAEKLLDFTNVTQADVSADDFYAKEMARIDNMSARNGAIGNSIIQSADQRLAGLEQLRLALNSASTQKEVDALTARIGVETAMLQNDTNRIQGLAMIQKAQVDVNAARERNAQIEQAKIRSEQAANLFGSSN